MEIKKNINIMEAGLLDCFNIKQPQTIIIGGSYSTNEGTIFHSEQTEYWLSDLDLLCVHEDGFSSKENQQIYLKMLKFSASIPQGNPYFHIGLKLRSPDQLKNEVSSLYFKELSHNSYTVFGEKFSNYFSHNQKFGFFHFSNEKINHILYKNGITRIWCNILFFPAQLFDNKKTDSFRIWYNYFFARGSLDWITSDLIRSGQWLPSYRQRYDFWKPRANLDKQTLNVFRDCIDTKQGISNVDIKYTIETINRHSFKLVDEFSRGANLSGVDYEFSFIKIMVTFIEIIITGRSHKSSSLIEEAIEFLAHLTQEKLIIYPDTPIKQWIQLRRIYSNFRFKRNPLDKFDHEIYTEHFLNLGS